MMHVIPSVKIARLPGFSLTVEKVQCCACWPLPVYSPGMPMYDLNNFHCKTIKHG